jgi:hypothetical protein
VGGCGLNLSGSRYGPAAGPLNTVVNLPVSQKAENFLTICETISFSRRTLLHGVGWLVGWLVKSPLHARSIFLTPSQ